MLNVPCPRPECEGEFEVQLIEDSDGDPDSSYTAPRLNWDVLSCTCNHDETEFTSDLESRFVDAITTAVLNSEP